MKETDVPLLEKSSESALSKLTCSDQMLSHPLAQPEVSIRAEGLKLREVKDTM